MSTFRRTIFSAVALVAAGLVAACNTQDRAYSPTAPQSSVEASSLDLLPPPPITLPGLTRVTPLTTDLVVSKYIGAAGGSVELPAVGVKLVVPAGAVNESTLFTIKAYKGSLIAYDFSPSRHWSTPLTISQDLGVSTFKVTPGAQLKAGYFPSESWLDFLNNTGRVLELRPVQVQPGGKAVFNVDHFSGYMLAAG